MSKNLYTFSLILFFSILSLSVYSQQRQYCGTSEYNDAWLKQFSENYDIKYEFRNCDAYLPITVHVLGNDDGIGYQTYTGIFSALNTLKEDFDSVGIHFFISGQINYINNTAWYDHSSSSVGNQMMNANNVQGTINCYIVENAANNCGYRSFGGNGIVIAKSCNGPNDHTWAHEMGHYFGLPHTFNGWESKTYDGSTDTPLSVGSRLVELADGTNCDRAADRFCDTSPDYLSYRWSCDENGESDIEQKDPNGISFRSDGTLIMSYALDNCQNRFSEEQKDAMCSFMNDFFPELVSTEAPMAEVDPLDTKLIYPIGGELVENEVTLEWEETGNATFYIVELSRIANMGILSFRQLVYGNSINVLGLSDNKTYYWRVRAFNNYDYDYNQISIIENFETGSISSTQDYYETRLRTFPNPVEIGATLTLELDSPISEEVSIEFITVEGKSVSQNKYFIRQGKNEINLNVAPSLPAGVSYIRVTGQLHNFFQKIIID